MGEEVLDPEQVEGEISRMPGLGLLPVSTTMNGAKTTRQVTFNDTMHGYEIHMGETTPTTQPSPLNTMDDGRGEGYRVDERCMGTYIHGILDNQEFIDMLLQPYSVKMEGAGKTFDYQAYKEEQYDKLAEHVRKHMDIDRLYKIMTEKEEDEND